MPLAVASGCASHGASGGDSCCASGRASRTDLGGSGKPWEESGRFWEESGRVWEESRNRGESEYTPRLA